MDYKYTKYEPTIKVDLSDCNFPPIPKHFVDQAIANMQAKIEHDLFNSMGIPPSIFISSPPQPEWAKQIIRIPESRIQEILGKLGR